MSEILIAEDDEDILALVTASLQREGYDLLKARTGERAFELARLRRPDLAILDIGLPDTDGLTVLRRIRAYSVLQSMPVVLLTSKAQEADIRRGLAAGADAYVRKPFSPTQLAQIVRELLTQTPGAA